MSKNKNNQGQKKDDFLKEKEKNNGIASVKNQLNESFQSGVVEDELENNRGIHTFNNQSK